MAGAYLCVGVRVDVELNYCFLVGQLGFCVDFGVYAACIRVFG